MHLDQARLLPQNAGICFEGVKKAGPFDLTPEDAARMLADTNPNGKPNGDVIKPYIIGNDLNGKPKERWLIDFGDMPEVKAQLYSLPYLHCLLTVKPVRARSREKRLRERWWMHSRNRIDLRQSIAPLTRFIGTSGVSKHRYFQFIEFGITPDTTIDVFAREDDYFLGILESRFHKVWTAAIGTQLESRPRYIISECFEKFPFPTPTEAQRDAVAATARTLDEQRRNVCRPNAAARTGAPMTALTRKPTCG